MSTLRIFDANFFEEKQGWVGSTRSHPELFYLQHILYKVSTISVTKSVGIPISSYLCFTFKE